MLQDLFKEQRKAQLALLAQLAIATPKLENDESNEILRKSLAEYGRELMYKTNDEIGVDNLVDITPFIVVDLVSDYYDLPTRWNAFQDEDRVIFGTTDTEDGIELETYTD